MQSIRTTLPTLREDLELVEGSPADNGEKNWLLYDPLQNKYFTIGLNAFKLLNLWENGLDIDEFIKKTIEQKYTIAKDDLEVFIKFITNNNLIKAEKLEDSQKIYSEYKESKLGFFKWILKNYLFIRIPIFKPDRWLEDNLVFANFFYSRFWTGFVLLLGFIGVVLTLRNWDEFINSFSYLFSSQGVFYYILSIIFVKTLHELGHAFTAKKYGCKVPTMGVAFLVLFPVLYTDTTDSWRIKSKYKRLRVVLAGMKVELYLALIATFLWSFLPDGILKTIVFVIATTSWITSLLINISPFLRFDGYYALSDYSDSKNLQPRSFAMARWFLRRNILGLDEESPEYLSKGKENFFIIYAILTWIYRFFLFLGIALLVYHFAFKVLGIFLFIVEILWFIVIPIYKELKVWFEKIHMVSLNRRNISSLIVFCLIIAFFVVPWNNKLYLPAVLEAKQHMQMYSPYKAQVNKIYFKDGEFVKKGDVLVELISLDNEFLLKQVNKEILLLKLELNRVSSSKEFLDKQLVLQEELLKKEERKTGLLKIKNSLVLKATFDGIVYKNDVFNINQWVNPKESILTIYNPSSLQLTAFCEETNLNYLKKDEKALFVFDDVNQLSIDVRIDEVSNISTAYLEFAELSSQYEGPIAVSMDSYNRLVTQKAYYKVYSKIDGNEVLYNSRKKGVLIVETEPVSIVESIYKNILALLIRESGF